MDRRRRRDERGESKDKAVKDGRETSSKYIKTRKLKTHSRKKEILKERKPGDR